MRLFRRREGREDNASKDNRSGGDNNNDNDNDNNIEDAASDRSIKESKDEHEIEVRNREQGLSEIKEKFHSIKEEYEATVSNLMLVKKELNQKKIELEIAQREYKDTREKSKKAELENHLRLNDKFYKTEEQCIKIKKELEEITEKRDEIAKRNDQIAEGYSKITERYNEVAGKNDQVSKEYGASVKKYNEIKQKIAQEEITLSEISEQQKQLKAKLDQAGSKSDNTQEQLAKNKKGLDDSAVPEQSKTTSKVSESQQSNAGIIKAASVVVGSLKAKLNLAHKELETLQTVLKKEREEHERTKAELKRVTAENADKSQTVK